MLVLSYLRLVLPGCLFQVSLPKPCIPYVPYALPISLFSHAPGLHIMKFLITQFFSVSVYVSLIRTRYVRLEVSLMQLVCQCMKDGRMPKYACLTLRLLMSYIYIYMEHLFLMFLDHTQRRTTVGRTPLDE